MWNTYHSSNDMLIKHKGDGYDRIYFAVCTHKNGETSFIVTVPNSGGNVYPQPAPHF
jgi:hypothetical protein